MAVINKFCFCCGLRGGSMFVATYSLLSSAFFIAILLIRNIGYGLAGASIIHGVLTYGSFVLFGLLMLISIGLIIGVHKENRWLLIPWLVQTIVCHVFATVTVVWLAIFIIQNPLMTLHGWEIALLAVHAFNMVCTLYCVLCVISLFQTFAEKEQTRQPSTRRRERRARTFMRNMMSGGGDQSRGAALGDVTPRPPALPLVSPPPYVDKPPPYTTFPRGAPVLHDPRAGAIPRAWGRPRGPPPAPDRGEGQGGPYDDVQDELEDPPPYTAMPEPPPSRQVRAPTGSGEADPPPSRPVRTSQTGNATQPEPEVTARPIRSSAESAVISGSAGSATATADNPADAVRIDDMDNASTSTDPDLLDSGVATQSARSSVLTEMTEAGGGMEDSGGEETGSPGGGADHIITISNDRLHEDVSDDLPQNLPVETTGRHDMNNGPGDTVPDRPPLTDRPPNRPDRPDTPYSESEVGSSDGGSEENNDSPDEEDHNNVSEESADESPDLGIPPALLAAMQADSNNLAPTNSDDTTERQTETIDMYSETSDNDMSDTESDTSSNRLTESAAEGDDNIGLAAAVTSNIQKTDRDSALETTANTAPTANTLTNDKSSSSNDNTSPPTQTPTSAAGSENIREPNKPSENKTLRHLIKPSDKEAIARLFSNGPLAASSVSKVRNSSTVASKSTDSTVVGKVGDRRSDSNIDKITDTQIDKPTDQSLTTDTGHNDWRKSSSDLDKMKQPNKGSASRGFSVSLEDVSSLSDREVEMRLAKQRLKKTSKPEGEGLPPPNVEKMVRQLQRASARAGQGTLPHKMPSETPIRTSIQPPPGLSSSPLNPDTIRVAHELNVEDMDNTPKVHSASPQQHSGQSQHSPANGLLNITQADGKKRLGPLRTKEKIYDKLPVDGPSPSGDNVNTERHNPDVVSRERWTDLSGGQEVRPPREMQGQPDVPFSVLPPGEKSRKDTLYPRVKVNEGRKREPVFKGPERSWVENKEHRARVNESQDGPSSKPSRGNEFPEGARPKGQYMQSSQHDPRVQHHADVHGNSHQQGPKPRGHHVLDSRQDHDRQYPNRSNDFKRSPKPTRQQAHVSDPTLQQNPRSKDYHERRNDLHREEQQPRGQHVRSNEFQQGPQSKYNRGYSNEPPHHANRGRGRRSEKEPQLTKNQSKSSEPPPNGRRGGPVPNERDLQNNVLRYTRPPVAGPSSRAEDSRVKPAPHQVEGDILYDGRQRGDHHKQYYPHRRAPRDDAYRENWNHKPDNRGAPTREERELRNGRQRGHEGSRQEGQKRSQDDHPEYHRKQGRVHRF